MPDTYNSILGNTPQSGGYRGMPEIYDNSVLGNTPLRTNRTGGYKGMPAGQEPLDYNPYISQSDQYAAKLKELQQRYIPQFLQGAVNGTISQPQVNYGRVPTPTEVWERSQGQSNGATSQASDDLKKAYEGELKLLQQEFQSPYAGQIDLLGQRVNEAYNLYNPYIEQGRQALTQYQRALKTPAQLSQEQLYAQQGDIGTANANRFNQYQLGSDKIDQSAALTGNLFGGNRLRAQGMLGAGLQQQFGQQRQGIENQYYQNAVADRESELGRLGGIVNYGQQAAQSFGNVANQSYGDMAKLYSQYGNNKANEILGKAQAEANQKSTELGLVGSLATALIF